jgi:hypothetical protein
MKNGGIFEGEWKNGLRVFYLSNFVGRIWKTYMAGLEFL